MINWDMYRKVVDKDENYIYSSDNLFIHSLEKLKLFVKIVKMMITDLLSQKIQDKDFSNQKINTKELIFQRINLEDSKYYD